MTLCICDTCNTPLQSDEVYAIGVYGGIPTDPSPNASGGTKVYRLLCRNDFIRLFQEHGHEANSKSLAQSHAIALEHLRHTGRLGVQQAHTVAHSPAARSPVKAHGKQESLIETGKQTGLAKVEQHLRNTAIVLRLVSSRAMAKQSLSDACSILQNYPEASNFVSEIKSLLNQGDANLSEQKIVQDCHRMSHRARECADALQRNPRQGLNSSLRDDQRIRQRSVLGTIFGSAALLLLLLILFALPFTSSLGAGGVGGGDSGEGAAQSGTGSGIADSDTDNGTQSQVSGDDANQQSMQTDSKMTEEQTGQAPNSENLAGDSAGSAEKVDSEESLVVRERPVESFAISDITRDAPSNQDDEEENTRASARRMQSSRSAIDEFGNPTASDAGLAKDGEFNGQSILVWVSDSGSAPVLQCEVLWAALRKKGFKITLSPQVGQGSFDVRQLKRHDQFWLFAGASLNITPPDLDAIESYVQGGKGLYVCADNDPYLQEAHELAQRFARAGVVGNYMGDKVMQINWGNQLDGSKYGATFKQAAHPLLTGINFLYEGITISHIEPVGRLKVVIRNSEKKPLVAVDEGRRKLIFDCGFTRYYPDYVTRTAGTVRYGENIAAWLAGKRSVSSK